MQIIDRDVTQTVEQIMEKVSGALRLPLDTYSYSGVRGGFQEVATHKRRFEKSGEYA